MPDIDDTNEFYTLVPEQGLCLIGDEIINLRKVALIRKAGGGTLLYFSGLPQPVTLPGEAFDKIREAVFAAADVDDEDDFDDEE